MPKDKHRKPKRCALICQHILLKINTCERWKKSLNFTVKAVLYLLVYWDGNFGGDWKGISPERSIGTTEMTYKALTLNRFYFIGYGMFKINGSNLSCISSQRKIYDGENDLHQWKRRSKFSERSRSALPANRYNLAKKKFVREALNWWQQWYFHKSILTQCGSVWWYYKSSAISKWSLDFIRCRKKTLLSTNNSLKKQQERLLSQEIKKTCQEKLSEIPTETPTGKKRGAWYTHMYNNNRTTSAVRKSSPKELMNKSTKRNKSCR